MFFGRDGVWSVGVAMTGFLGGLLVAMRGVGWWRFGVSAIVCILLREDVGVGSGEPFSLLVLGVGCVCLMQRVW